MHSKSTFSIKLYLLSTITTSKKKSKRPPHIKYSARRSSSTHNSNKTTPLRKCKEIRLHDYMYYLFNNKRNLQTTVNQVNYAFSIFFEPLDYPSTVNNKSIFEQMLPSMPPAMQRITILRMIPRLCTREQKSMVPRMFQFLQSIEPLLNAKCGQSPIRNREIPTLGSKILSDSFL